MPYGRFLRRGTQPGQPVSIPHMGCMPYGQSVQLCPVVSSLCFNPSYGLHALRALHQRGDDYRVAWVSIPHMGCMPYGPVISDILAADATGFNPSYGLHALRAPGFCRRSACDPGFNPSYGLHALRARSCGRHAQGFCRVSIPHMGCMPYGRRDVAAIYKNFMFQSLIWVACPTGEAWLAEVGVNLSFQSLIWVACPTGSEIKDSGWYSYGFNPSYGLHALRALPIPHWW